MISAFLKELSSFRTAALAIVAVLFQLNGVSQIQDMRGVNVWDVALPAFTDAHFLVIFFMLWWLLAQNETASNLVGSARLIRYGTRRKALLQNLGKMVLQISAAYLVVFVTAIPFALRTGVDGTFSAQSLNLAKTQESLSVYSAASWSKVFANPILPLVLSGTLLLLAFASMSILLMALTLNGFSRLSYWFCLCIYLWSAYCTLGLPETLGFLDSSALFVFGWAAHHSAVVQVIMIWTALGFLAFFLARPARLVLVALELPGRWAGLAVASVIAFLISLDSSAIPLAEKWRQHFAGPADSLVGYSRVAILIALIASAAVVRFDSHQSDEWLHSRIRYGSRWRWTVSKLADSISFSVAGTALVLVGAGAAISFGSTSSNFTDVIVSPMSLGLELTTLLATLAGITVVSFTKTLEPWFWLIAVFLVLGYFSQSLPSSINVFALYATGLSETPVARETAFASASVLIATLITVSITANLDLLRPKLNTRKNG